MTADERRVDVIPIPLALLEGAMEVRVHTFLAGFLVDVDGPQRRAFAEVGTMVALV